LLAAWELGAVAVKAAVERAGVPGDAVDEVLLGNCLMAGQGSAGAPGDAPRRAARQHRRRHLTKMCGSGMRTMMFGHDMLLAGSANIIVAGGMESMTNAPHLVFARKGVRYGATQMYDHMAMDGLEDAYERGKRWVSSRAVRGQVPVHARGAGPLRDPVHRAQQEGQRRRQLRLGDSTGHLAGQGGETLIRYDEQPFKAKLDKIPGLKPAFKKTARSPRQRFQHFRRRCRAGVDAREHGHADGLKPLARIVGHAVHAQRPTGSRPRRWAPSRRC